MTIPQFLDHRFRVRVITQTPNPQQAIYGGMHQDYSETYVGDEMEDWPSEDKCGEICIKHLLAGERGHYGPLEHAQIVFSTGYFPHSVMQQARTHRIGVSFDVQSMRYTGSRICAVAKGDLPIEDAFYLRPVGVYNSRKGAPFNYTAGERAIDLNNCYISAVRYAELIEAGAAEEQAREILATGYRQHFVVSFTMRALMHFLDMRSKLDAQLEIRQLCLLMFLHFKAWAPEIADWYEEKRLGRARLAP